MYKFIYKISNRLFPKEMPKHLGRWNIESCDKKINYKIDLSNEDHCGPCGNYAVSVNKSSVSNTKSSELNINSK
jgi:hypothetical protein